MSTEQKVTERIMDQMVSNRDSYVRGIRRIWACKDPLTRAVKLKEQLEASGMEVSISSSLLCIGQVGLTVQLGTDHSLVRDVLPIMEEIMADYEAAETHKFEIRGEVQMKHRKVLSNGQRVTLIVSVLTGQSTACRWVGTGKFVELQDLVCDEQAA